MGSSSSLRRFYRVGWLMALCGALCVALVGCDADTDGASPEPYAELRDLGLDRYLGVDQPIAEQAEEGVTVWSWAHDPGGDSPGCLRGDPYYASSRKADSDNLVVFLQGGGACWSDFCLAFDKATKGVPPIDVLDPDLAVNPVRGWNMVYLPYCDGGLFAGDARIDDDGDGQVDRDYRGLRNLSAALSAAKAAFPSPKRILLAGSSGGGFGLVLGLPLARMVWPDAELMVMNDSGVGVAKSGDPAFIQQLLKEFGASDLVPASCEGCFDDGHLTNLLRWSLERDPTVRMAAFSSMRDYVIANLFLQTEPAKFETALRAEMAELEAAFPGRFAAFLTLGTSHTALLGDISGFTSSTSSSVAALGSFLGGLTTTETDGVQFSSWFKAFIEGGEQWRPISPSAQ